MAHKLIALASVACVLGSPLASQCSSPQGNITLSLLGHPALGNAITWRTTAQPSSPAIWLIGGTPGTQPVPWGTVCVTPDASLIFIPHQIDSGGNDSVAFSVPADSHLVGVAVHSQDLVADPNTPGGVALSQRVSFTIAGSNLVFSEDFQSYAPGTFPYTNGWVRYYGSWAGAIVPMGCSGTQGLELMGDSCWANLAYRPLPTLTRARFECTVRLAHLGSGGCSLGRLGLGFWSPPNNCTWGCPLAHLDLAGDGSVHIRGTAIRSYVPGQCYRIAVTIDTIAQSATFEMDGQLISPSAFSYTGGPPPGIMLLAGHSVGALAHFDDIRVYAQ